MRKLFFGRYLSSNYNNKSMNTPNGVPTTAKWDKVNQLWQAGETSKRKPVGGWKWWLPSGRLHIEAFYNENGKLEGKYQKFHLDGSLREIAHYKDGILDGKQTLKRSKRRTQDGLPVETHWSIWSIEYDYKNGFLMDSRFLNNRGGVAMVLPRFVPIGAIYTSRGYWEHGNYDGQKKVGKWNAWRNNGHLYSEKNYVNGQLHGLQKDYHQNGELAIEAEYKHHKLDGKTIHYRVSSGWSDIRFPYEANTVVVKIIKYYKNNTLQEQEYFKTDGSICNRHGRPILAVKIDKAYTGKVINFVDEGLKTYLKEAHTSRESIEVERLKARFEILWGKAIPADLEKSVVLFYQSNFPKILDFQTYPLRLSCLDDEDLNIVEEAILNAQTSFPAENIIDWFSGTVCLDKLTKEGYSKYNSLQYGLYDTQVAHLSTNQIYQLNFYSPNYGVNLRETKADSISSLLMLYSSADAYEYQDLIKSATFLSVFQKTKNKVQGDYYTFSDIKIGEGRRSNDFNYYDLRYQGQQKPSVNYFNKNNWILERLRFNNSNPNAYPIPKRQNYNVNAFQTVVPEALHCLFASYFQREDKANDKFLEMAKSHSSRIVQDTGELIAEFRNGRKRLGLIRDMEALRT